MLIRAIDRVEERWADDFESVTDAQWLVLRPAMVLLLLVGVHFHRLVRWAELPDAMFEPRSLSSGSLLESWPSSPTMAALSVLVIATAVWLGMSRRADTAIAAYAIAIIIANGVAFSLGAKVIHHLWVEIVIICLAGTAWAGSTRRDVGPALGIAAWIIGWSMWTAAGPKLRGGWLSPDSSAVLGEVEYQVAAGDAEVFLGETVAGLDSALFELLDWVTVGFEALLFLAVLHPVLFRTAVRALLVFHLANLLLFDITFDPLVIAYLPFFAPVLPLSRLERWTRSLRWTVMGVGLAAAAFASAGAPPLTEWAATTVGLPGQAGRAVVLLALAPALALTGLGRDVAALRRSPVSGRSETGQAHPVRSEPSNP